MCKTCSEQAFPGSTPDVRFPLQIMLIEKVSWGGKEPHLVDEEGPCVDQPGRGSPKMLSKYVEVAYFTLVLRLDSPQKTRTKCASSLQAGKTGQEAEADVGPAAGVRELGNEKESAQQDSQMFRKGCGFFLQAVVQWWNCINLIFRLVFKSVLFFPSIKLSYIRLVPRVALSWILSDFSKIFLVADSFVWVWMVNCRRMLIPKGRLLYFGPK